MGFVYLTVAASAQDAVPPGLLARFDVTQRLEYSDNPDLDVNGDSDFFGRTLLGFRLDSATAISNFGLALSTEIEEGRDDQSTIDLTNSLIDLTYNRDTRNAFFGLDARYRESDLNDDDFELDFDQDGNVINQTDGTRRSFGFDLEGGVGQEAPIGASFSWSYNEINFSGTSDSDLNDSSNSDFSGQVDFRIDPRITASLTARYIDFDTSGSGVDRETTGLGALVNLEVTPIHTVDAFLSYDEIERSGGETGTDEGISAGIDWTRQMPNGTFGVSFSSEVSSNDDGRRAFLSVFRDMDLPRGALSVRLGLTGEDVVGTDPLVDISYQHERRTSLLTFGVAQTVVSDDDNNEQVNTTLRASYDYEINNLSGLGVSLAFFDRNELQDTDPNDGQRVEISLTYRYDLTRDWGLVGGYSHTLTKEDDDEDRDRNTIFVGLQRSFSWTP